MNKKCKTIVWLLVMVLICVFPFSTPLAADDDVSIYINGSRLEINDGKPQVIGAGTTMVPFRAIFEALGFSVSYTENDGVISVWATSLKRDTVIGLKTGDKNLYQCTYNQYVTDRSNLNAALAEMPEAPFVDDTDRTLIPLRAVSESIGASVVWDGETNSVWISDSNNEQVATMNTVENNYTFNECLEKYKNRKCIAVCSDVAIGLRKDGTVICQYDEDDCNLSGCDNWTGIISVDCGYHFVVGLKSNGRVVAVGDNKYGQCNVSDWSDIVSIAVGSYHVIGLKSDGTVVAAGRDTEGQCSLTDIGESYKICGIWAGYRNTVLKLYMNSTTGDVTNNTYVFTYGTEAGATSYSLDQESFLALQSDGSIVAGENGKYTYEDFDIEYATDWKNKSKVLCTCDIVACMDDNGFVYTLNTDIDTTSWSDIVDIAGDTILLGVRSDGTIEYAASASPLGLRPCRNWTNIGFPE